MQTRSCKCCSIIMPCATVLMHCLLSPKMPCALARRTLTDSQYRLRMSTKSAAKKNKHIYVYGDQVSFDCHKFVTKLVSLTFFSPILLFVLTAKTAQSRCPGGSGEQAAHLEKNQHHTTESHPVSAPVLHSQLICFQRQSPLLVVSAAMHLDPGQFTGL